MCWLFVFFSSRRRHTRCGRDWSSDVCSSDLSMKLGFPGEEFFGGEAFIDLWIARQHDAWPTPGPGVYLMPFCFELPEHRSEERRVGKECRSRWSPYH